MAVARGRSPSQFRYPGREACVSIIAPQRSNSAHLRRPRRATVRLRTTSRAFAAVKRIRRGGLTEFAPPPAGATFAIVGHQAAPLRLSLSRISDTALTE